MRQPSAAPPYLEPTRGGFLLSLHVVPGASRTQVVGPHGDRLKIRVAAPPAKGAANRELLRFLSATTGRPRSSIELVRGAGSRRKTVRMMGVHRAAALTAALTAGE